MIKAIKQNNKITVGVPFKWKRPNTDGYFHGYDTKLTDEDHYADGWGDVLLKDPITEFQRYGSITHNEEDNNFFYPVIDKSPEELTNEILANSEAQKQQLIASKTEAKIIEDAQAIENDTEALENQALYPFWEHGKKMYLNNKFQFISNNELMLFKVNQPEVTMDDLYPPNPDEETSLYTRINYPNEIKDWEQRGSTNPYMTGDKCYFPVGSTTIWQSKIDNNTWSPTTYPQGWELA